MGVSSPEGSQEYTSESNHCLSKLYLANGTAIVPSVFTIDGRSIVSVEDSGLYGNATQYILAVWTLDDSNIGL